MPNNRNDFYWLVTIKILFVGLMFLFALNPLNANSGSIDESEAVLPELVAKPRRCVALRQGQTCYQRATLSWQTAEEGYYCLYSVGKKTPLSCWKDAKEGSFSLQFKASETQQFQLRHGNKNSVLATTELTVAWVYENKKRGRASWRLF